MDFEANKENWLHGGTVSFAMARVGIDHTQIPYEARAGTIRTWAKGYHVFFEPGHPDSWECRELSRDFWSIWVNGVSRKDGWSSSSNWDSSSFGCIDQLGRPVRTTGTVFNWSDLLTVFPTLGPRLQHALKEEATINSAQLAETAQTSARTKKASSNVGAKVNKEMWESFAAAFAVLADRGQLDLRSESKTHKSVADFLIERGHEDCLSVDSVRQMIRRFGAWSKGVPFEGDMPADVGGTD